MLATHPRSTDAGRRAASRPWAFAGTAGLALLAACAGADGEPRHQAELERALAEGGEGISRHALTAADLAALPGSEDDYRPEDDGYDDDWDDDEDAASVPDLGPSLSRDVSRLVRRLQLEGELGDDDWERGSAPPDDVAYARIPLDDDGDSALLDGFSTDAWVPVDAAGRPAGDDVYVVRRGGVAGWQFTAGPFTLDRAEGIELGPRDSGRPLRVPAGSRLVVRLPDWAAAGSLWRVAGGALAPSHTEADADELVARYHLDVLEPGDYLVGLEAGEGTGAPPAFAVPLTVTADIGDDAW